MNTITQMMGPSRLPRSSFAQEPRPQPYFPLYSQQADFVNSTATYRGFVGGRGSGKSKVGAYDIIVKAKPGRHNLVVGPTYPMLRDSTLESFREVCQILGLHFKLNEQKMQGWINGALQFR